MPQYSFDKEHLPVGDRLASLALSLHNDIKLAMEIPLVAQFIVCPREELYHVFKFQEELVVTQDMIDESPTMAIRNMYWTTWKKNVRLNISISCRTFGILIVMTNHLSWIPSKRTGCRTYLMILCSDSIESSQLKDSS